MRTTSTIILIILLMGLYSPLSVRVYAPSGSDTQYIVTLDVCHAGGHAVSVNGSAPYIPCQCCSPADVPREGFAPARDDVFKVQPLAYMMERPPQA